MRSRSFAFTLVEILICLAVTMILLAIALGVYRQGMRSGKQGVEIDQMHQLSLAATLYHDQNNDTWPENTQALVSLKMVPAEICLSPRDRYARGFANEYLSALGNIGGAYATKVAGFPNTYLCIGDLWIQRRDEMNRMLTEQENPGLFVSLIDSTSRFGNDNPSGPFDGRYYRALLDGSVVVRRHQRYGKAHSDSTLFFDPSEQWVREFVKMMGGDGVVAR